MRIPDFCLDKAITLKKRIQVVNETLTELERIYNSPITRDVDISINYHIDEYDDDNGWKEYRGNLQIPPTQEIIADAIESVKAKLSYYKDELDLLAVPTYMDIRALMGEFGEDITLKDLVEKFKCKEGESDNEQYFEEIVKKYYDGREEKPD